MSDARPRIVCHMLTSVDGRLHPSRFTGSPDGAVPDWNRLAETLRERYRPDGWIVGRATMAEMTKGEPHPPAHFDAPMRPMHLARRGHTPVAIAFDRTGRLHFRAPEVGGDPVVVVLGSGVGEAHLAELAGDGVSYLVSSTPGIDLAGALATLKRELGLNTLTLEGGAEINGAFVAAGLVDELSVVVAPALDGDPGTQGIVDLAGGLRHHARLSLLGCERLDHGAVHLRYAVTPR